MDFSHITKNWKKPAGIASIALLCGSALVYTTFFHEEEATSTTAVSKSVETATGSASEATGKDSTAADAGKTETQEVEVKETSGTEAGMATAPGGNVTVVTGKEEFATEASSTDSDTTATGTTAAQTADTAADVQATANATTAEATKEKEKTVEETYTGTITDDGYVVTGEAVDGAYDLSSAGVENAVYVDAEARVYYLQKDMTADYFKANATKLVVSSLKQAEAKNYKQATLAE